MATKCECWKSTSANVFDTEHDALRDDLRGWLVDTGAVNEAAALQLTNHIASDLGRMKEFAAMIGRMTDTHPAQPKVEG